jgi:hypothetical protein
LELKRQKKEKEEEIAKGKRQDKEGVVGIQKDNMRYSACNHVFTPRGGCIRLYLQLVALSFFRTHNLVCKELSHGHTSRV